MFKNRSASASDEKTLFDYADEPPTTSLGPTTYPISASNLISNTIMSVQNPIASIRVPAYYAVVTWDGSNTWYNSTVPLYANQISPGNPYTGGTVVGVPSTTTGTVLSLAQLNTALATVTSGMTSTLLKTLGYFAAYLTFYDVQLPPGQASASVNGWTGPPSGDTITVTSHPNITPVHGTPYCAVQTPLATFTCSRTTLQNLQFIRTINWGDGNTSISNPSWIGSPLGYDKDSVLTATGSTDSGWGNTTGGTLKLYAAHTYATAGTFTVTVTISEAPPGTGTATTTLTATVTAAATQDYFAGAMTTVGTTRTVVDINQAISGTTTPSG